MERRLLGILLIVLLALATAAPLYAQQGAPSGTGPRRVDPGIRSAGAVIGLERTTDNRVRKDQAKRILPMMKVLRGMKMADREAGDASRCRSGACSRRIRRTRCSRCAKRAGGNSSSSAPRAERPAARGDRQQPEVPAASIRRDWWNAASS